MVVESLDLLLVFTNGVIKLLALKVSAVRHLPNWWPLFDGVAADPGCIFFVTFVSFSVHLDETLDGKGIDHTYATSLAM